MTFPTEDASAQELSNITIPDSPENAPQTYHFGEHQQEHIAEAPAKVFCTGIVPHEGQEVMEDLPPDGENMSSDRSEESDSDEGTPRHRCSNSVSQTEEEGKNGVELTEEPTEELTEELMEEPAEKLAEEPIEELTEGPTEGPTEETTVKCPTLG